MSSRLGPLLATLVALLLVVACAAPVQPLAPVPTAAPTPPPPIQFPRDAGTHDNLTEWWYFTGHLFTPDGAQQYGFEYTVFQLERQGAPTAYLAHFAVTDVTHQTFSHQAQFITGDPQPGFNLNVQGWRLFSQDGTDVIQAQMTPGPGTDPPFGLRLKLTDEKPPALHNGGYIDYGPAGGSYYYSRTRIAAQGQVIDASGQPQNVSGEAWMDHQWGNFVLASAGGWDWFSLQLNNNTEVMLYVLRAADGSRSGVYGSLIGADGAVQEIPANTVQVQATDTWTSRHTGGTYPSGWQVQVPQANLSLNVQPLVKDQELYFPGFDVGGISYWEGAVSLTNADGSAAGEGYVELTGYAPARPFVMPGT